MVVVRVITLFEHRRMNRHISHHAAADERRLNEAQEQFAPLGGIQLMGQCQIDFTGKLGVFAALHPFDQIPQVLSVTQSNVRADREDDFS